MDTPGRGGSPVPEAALRKSVGTGVMWLLAAVVYMPSVWLWCAALNGTERPSPYDGQANHEANIELAQVSVLIVVVPVVGCLLGVAVGKLVRTNSIALASGIGTICSLVAWYWWMFFHIQAIF